MQSIENSFSKKRKATYDHYDRYERYNYRDMSRFDEQSNTYTYTPPNAGPSSYRRPFMPAPYNEAEARTPPPLTTDPTFDILDWHPAYQSCQRYFLDHAQHEPATQALCALVNIRLPFQYFSNPIESSARSNSSNAPRNNTYPHSYPRSGGSPHSPHREPPVHVSLLPYVKRLVVTGFDKPAILHGFFGEDYKRGIVPHLDCERRNYLFAAKQGGWGCKKQYDIGSGMGGDESVPFMKPLDEAKTEELTAADKAWSGWLAMEDWMVGPRAPKEEGEDFRFATDHERQGGDRGVRMNGHQNLPDGVTEAFQQREGGSVSPNDGMDGIPEAPPPP